MKYAWIEELIEVEVEVLLRDENDMPVLDENGQEQPVILVDAEGVPILDENGDPQIEMETIMVGSGNGEVTGINRGPIEGESLGNATPQEFIWAYYPQYYSVVNGVLVPMSVEDKETLDNKEGKDDAYNQVMGDIDELNSTMNKEDFDYSKGDGEPTYSYTADPDSIQAVAIECANTTSTDPIPVPNGVWKTSDVAEDGVTSIYVPFSCGEFQEFKSAYFMRGSANFGVKEVHKNAVKALYLDPTSTPEDILGYDITTGWN